VKLYARPESLEGFRVRIALNVKSIPYESGRVRDPQGEAEGDASALARARVPRLQDGQRIISQSLAIVEYLDEQVPSPPLLPGTARDRARVRSIAQLIACDIQPLTDERVHECWRGVLQLDEERWGQWQRSWLRPGLSELEDRLADNPATARFCHDDYPTLADICLVPLVYGAVSAGEPLDEWPTVRRIYEHCMTLDAFRKAAPAPGPAVLRLRTGAPPKAL
jgi:maleylpyruvate isomerase